MLRLTLQKWILIELVLLILLQKNWQMWTFYILAYEHLLGTELSYVYPGLYELCTLAFIHFTGCLVIML